MNSRSDNERFTEAVTTQAFALTLSRAMIVALADVVKLADSGHAMPFANDRGLSGLERRGLVAWSAIPTEAGKPGYGWLPTRAGRLTLELCKCAGLQEGDPGDDFLAAIRDRMAAQAEREREASELQERQHTAWVANLRAKSREPAA